MKVVFVVIGAESLAAEYLSSYVEKHGHEAEIVFDTRMFPAKVLNSEKLTRLLTSDDGFVEDIISRKPDMVGIPVFSVHYQRALKIAKLVKSRSPNVRIILGGIHPSSIPEFVIKEKCIDMVCVGEGEEALVELLDNLRDKKESTSVKNIWFKKDGKVIINPVRRLIANLDDLPFPAKDKYYLTQPGYAKRTYVCISSRGCPFACTYCSNHLIQNIYKGMGHHNRRRSPENMIDELVWAKKNFNPKIIFFNDDVFAQDEEWLERFVKLYKAKIRLPYFAMTHAKFLNLNIARMLKESGCYRVSFGIQTSSEKTRTEVLRRFETNDQIKKAAEVCHQVDLDLAVDHIFNLPSEDLDNQIESLKFCNELRPKVINANYLLYFPKNHIIDFALKYRLMTAKDVKRLNLGYVFSNKKSEIYENMRFICVVLPYLPQKLVDQLIEMEIYKKKYTPAIVRRLAESVVGLFGNGYNYFEVLENALYFSWRNIRLNLRYRSQF